MGGSTSIFAKGGLIGSGFSGDSVSMVTFLMGEDGGIGFDFGDGFFRSGKGFLVSRDLSGFLDSGEGFLASGDFLRLLSCSEPGSISMVVVDS